MLLSTTCGWYECYISANFSQTPTLTLNWLSWESQWNVDSNDILCIWKYCQLFVHKSNTFLLMNTPLKPVGQWGTQPQNPPFPLTRMNPHLVNECVGLPHSSPQMTAQSVHAVLHYYTTNNHFTALWTLSGKTQLSWYLKVHFTIFWILWCKMKITQVDRLTIRMDCHPIQINWCPHLCHPHHFYAGCPSWHNPSNLSWLGTGTKYAGLHTRWLDYHTWNEIYCEVIFNSCVLICKCCNFVVGAFTPLRCRSTSGSSSSGGYEAQKRYFWQYNVQSKGPKCQPPTAQFLTASSDPYILSCIHDPMTDSRSRTSSNYSRQQRDQSMTDTDANPRRLLQIGDELQQLTSVVNAAPGTTADSSLSAREKNKYASRICRLKRKAQHEANKIKLQGLEQEHRE